MEYKIKRGVGKYGMFLVIVLLFFSFRVFAQSGDVDKVGAPSQSDEIMAIDTLYNYDSVHRYGDLDVKRTVVQPGKYLEPITDTDYEVTYYDFNDNVITSIPYVLGFFGEPFWNVEAPFFIPHYPNTKRVAIRSVVDGRMTVSNVGYFADVCGDGMCERHESYVDCPQDCASGGLDDYCDQVQDGICDPDCVGINEDEPFAFDGDDCGIPDPSECDGSLVCHPEANLVLTCIKDKNKDPHWYFKQKCNQGETCEDGFCGGLVDQIDGYVCNDNDGDCWVNGEQWACVCGKCRRPGTFLKGRMCCNERLN